MKNAIFSEKLHEIRQLSQCDYFRVMSGNLSRNWLLTWITHFETLNSRKNANALWNFYSSPVKMCISEYFFWLQSSVEVIIFKCVGDHRPRTSSLESEDSCLSDALDLTSEPLFTACNDWSTEIMGPRFVKLFLFSWSLFLISLVTSSIIFSSV